MAMNLDDLLPVGITIVILTIVLAYGANVVGDVGGDFTENSTEYNITQDGLEATENLSSKMPLIVTVIVAALVIGILLTYFSFGRR